MDVLAAAAPPSTAERVRVPLQIGSSAIRSLARSANAALVAALIAFGPIATGSAGFFAWGLMFLPGVLGLGWAALNDAQDFFLFRASDALIDRDGIAVDGDRRGRVPFAALDLAKAEVFLTEEFTGGLRRFLPGGKADRWALSIPVRDGDSIRVEVETDEEADSLRDFLASLRAMHGGAAEADPFEPPADALRCGGCGAVVHPVDATQATCVYCGGVTAVPDFVRGRIAAAREAERRSGDNARLVGQLLAQPGAQSVRLLAGLLAVPVLAAVPACVAIGIALALARRLEPLGCLALMLFPAALTQGAAFVLHARVANRRALQRITVGLAARPPTRVGEPPRCRACLAPLLAPRAGVIGACDYCGAENVLGLGFGARLANERAQSQSLEAALARRTHDRARAGKRLAVGLGLLAVAVALLILASRSADV